MTKQFGFEEKKTPSQISDDEDKKKPTITKMFKSQALKQNTAQHSLNKLIKERGLKRKKEEITLTPEKKENCEEPNRLD